MEKETLIFDKLDLIPRDIFHCGQAFHWEYDGSYYHTVHRDRVISIKKEGKKIYIRGATRKEWNEVWKEYFDIATDYKEIRKELEIHEPLKQALEYGQGIRILRQDPFETIITFIISSNSHIPRIKNTVKTMSKEYGQWIENRNGLDFYAFPRPEQLAKVSAKEIREIGRVGYRDRYIIDTAKIIAECTDFTRWRELTTKQLRKKLMKLPGVGPKVCDCILLFAYHRMEVFPVDVWIHRVMESLFLKETIPRKEIAKKAYELFGNYGGYAQQYLFYYGKDHKIGVN
ncbi:MAG: DNA glycosylase [Tissierellia bacterium]|nr:DNA glycosylase [Tissierellia bacterium]